MVRAKNYETVSTFVKVIQKKTVASFFPDTVYTRIFKKKLQAVYFMLYKQQI